MKRLFLEKKEDTPRVLLDKQNRKFEISGRSMPEDAFLFYQPIQNWIDEYVEDPEFHTIFEFNLEYFNSTSVKQLLEILFKLEKIKEKGKGIQVLWYYNELDELMEAKGLEIKNLCDLPFEMRSF